MGIINFRNVVVFGLGAAAGYFIGSREGRKQAEELARQAQQFWTAPETQEKVHTATQKAADFVKDKAPDQISEPVAKAADAAAEAVDKSTGYADSDSDSGSGSGSASGSAAK